MLTIVSYIIKIAISLILVYSLSYFIKKNQVDNLDLILKFNFISVFLLSPIYNLSLTYNTFFLFSVCLLLLAAFIFYINNENERNFLLVSLVLSVLISINYIIYSIIGTIFYIFIDNNLSDFIKNDKEIDSFD
tara:strand:- start:327 stop:725 length:399 start_codon:yes stop_codon:yes gene_type:complete